MFEINSRITSAPHYLTVSVRKTFNSRQTFNSFVESQKKTIKNRIIIHKYSNTSITAKSSRADRTNAQKHEHG